MNAGITVLIETLWNVNVIAYDNVVGSCCRINRNIVECKLLIHLVCYSHIIVLIETLWNVNESNGTWHKSPKVGINRNIVECKYR